MTELGFLWHSDTSDCVSTKIKFSERQKIVSAKVLKSELYTWM